MTCNTKFQSCTCGRRFIIFTFQHLFCINGFRILTKWGLCLLCTPINHEMCKTPSSSSRVHRYPQFRLFRFLWQPTRGSPANILMQYELGRHHGLLTLWPQSSITGIGLLYWITGQLQQAIQTLWFGFYSFFFFFFPRVLGVFWQGVYSKW